MTNLQRRLAVVIALAFILIPFNAVASLASGSLPASTASTAPTAGVTTQPTAGSAGSTSPVLPPVLDANGQPVSPGTLPNSPFYWLANLMQRVQLFFTFDSAQKAALLENQALKNLAAAQQMAKAGNTAGAQKSLASYVQKVADAQALLTKLADPKTVQTLQSAIAKSDAANIQVLSGLLVKIPAPGAKAVALNIMRAIEKVADKMDDADKQKVRDEMGQSGTVFNQAQLGEDAVPVMASLQKSLATSTAATAAVSAATVTTGTAQASGNAGQLTNSADNRQAGTATPERDKEQEREKVLNQPSSTQSSVQNRDQAEHRSISPSQNSVGNRTSGDDKHKASSTDGGENDD